jgi:predicted kinase
MATSKLIVMSGLPGSGKSTIAQQIASRLQIPLFSVDPIESAIIKAGLKRSFETGLAAYLVAEVLATEQLKLGNSVVVDAVNAEDEGKQVWLECSARLQVPLVVIECVLENEDLHRERLEKRIRKLHGFSEVSWERVVARRKVYTPWKRDILRLEMSESPEANLKAALEFIARSH